jgi:uncharacterized membrane protein YukC
VKLESLSDDQKLVIGKDLTATSPDLLLDYWIAIGRGHFARSLDLGKKLDNPQLTLYSYTKLYVKTQLSRKIKGQAKQERLAEYEREMDKLMKEVKADNHDK